MEAKEKWILLKNELPKESGTYKVLNNQPSCNNGIGEAYYSTEKGWDIPDMIKGFYKIIAWQPKTPK